MINFCPNDGCLARIDLCNCSKGHVSKSILQQERIDELKRQLKVSKKVIDIWAKGELELLDKIDIYEQLNSWLDWFREGCCEVEVLQAITELNKKLKEISG